MKTLILALAGVVLPAGIAAAADIVPAPLPPTYTPEPAPLAYDWSGLYVGGHLGGAWEDTQSTSLAPTALFPAGTSTGVDADGFIGGGHAGYNFQNGPWVFGVEGDISWSGVDGSATIASPIVLNGSSTLTTDTNSYATFTGRLGYAGDHWLAYVEAGGAWADVDYTASGAGGMGPVASSTVSDTRDGYVLGGGVDVALDSNWSAKFEYNYMDFGTENYTFAVGGVPTPTAIESDAHVAKVGLTYNFNLFSPAPAY